MPRGIYDRTKSKEQRAAEKGGGSKKAAKSAVPKRKYTKRAAVADTNPVKFGTPKMHSTSLIQTLTQDIRSAQMSEIRSNLSVLSVVAEKFGDLPSIKTEVDAHVILLGSLREKLYATEDPTQDTVENVEPEADEEQPAAVTQAAPYTSVPLPPPVTPVLPPPVQTH